MESGWARFAGMRARRVCDYADLRTEPHALAGGGWWAVVAEFDGPWHAWRFADVEGVEAPAKGASGTDRDDGFATGGVGTGRHERGIDRHPAGTGHHPDPACGQGAEEGHPPAPWRGPGADSWTSSMDRDTYEAAVRSVREAVREGEVYQANICRVLSAPMPAVPDAGALAAVLAAGNPAPYGGALQVPGGGRSHDGEPIPGVWVVTASPELGLRVRGGWVTSGPIKGTAPTAAGLTEKDRAENVMITDLVRNDLQRVCLPGTVAVADLLAVEAHPGLVHLVSRVTGRLARPDLRADGARGWAELLAATQPPGSVSGAPKSSALDVIARLERAPRGPYCGQIGWIDADAGAAELAVGIRTFWWDGQALQFGTGAGITYGSDPAGEWAETELKAARLVALASAGSGKVEP